MPSPPIRAGAHDGPHGDGGRADAGLIGTRDGFAGHRDGEHGRQRHPHPAPSSRHARPAGRQSRDACRQRRRHREGVAWVRRGHACPAGDEPRTHRDAPIRRDDSRNERRVEPGRSRLFRLDSAPIWRVAGTALPNASPITSNVWFTSAAGGVLQYYLLNILEFVTVELVAFVALFVSCLGLRRHARRWVNDRANRRAGTDPALRTAISRGRHDRRRRDARRGARHRDPVRVPSTSPCGSGRWSTIAPP
jgi:hypothetical protein